MTTSTDTIGRAPNIGPSQIEHGDPPREARAAGRPACEVAHVLDRVAEQIVADGTRSVAPVVEAMAAAVRHVSPGVAAALVDWDGSEVSRQRAFGIAHGVIVNVLGAPGDARTMPAHGARETAASA